MHGLSNVTIKREPEGRFGSAFDLQPIESRAAEEQRGKVDVVLVHGLTGDPMQTWGGKVGKCGELHDFWPKELAKELNAKAAFWTMRCPFYGFNVQEKSRGRNFKDDAEEALRQCEGKLGDKPIIFVAHSLGGLLVKKMLDINSKSEGTIVEKTHTVMFVGTPHCGSPHVRWHYLVPFLTNALGWSLGKLVTPLLVSLLGAGVGGLASIDVEGWIKWDLGSSAVIGAALALLLWFARYLLNVSRYVQMLDLGEPDLMDLASKYRDLVAKQPIITLAFMEDVPLFKFLHIVPRYSADPGIPGCDPIGIYANHIDMCKGDKATEIRKAIVRHVDMAGGFRAVFEDKLARITSIERLRPPLNALIEKVDGELRFRKKFKDVSVQDNLRIKGDKALRDKVRAAIVKKDFKVGNGELERARCSTFDVDKIVWEIWYEQQIAALARELKTMAEHERDSWNKVWQKGSDSLILFYRPLRTIAHSLLLDLKDAGAGKKDRELILDFISEARIRLKDLSKTGADGDGSTRWLLLQLYCVLKTAGLFDELSERITQKYPKGKEVPDKYENELEQLKDTFDKNLKKLENKLKKCLKFEPGE